MELQEDQYTFPYHHVPQVKDGYISHIRSRSWAFSYMALLLKIRENILDKNPSSVLDVGCGDGRLLGLLPERIQRVGIDLSVRAIHFAKGFYPDIKFKRSDIKDIKDSFDVVSAIEVLEHIPDSQLAEFVNNLGRVCKTGGHLILTVPSDNRPVAEKHFRHYSKKLLENHLEHLDDQFFLEECRPLLKQEDPIYKVFKKVASNKFWVFESVLLNKLIWWYYKNFCIEANESNGIHWMVVLKKNG